MIKIWTYVLFVFTLLSLTLSHVCLARNADTALPDRDEAPPAQPNLIMEPEYSVHSAPTPTPSPPNKLQYQPLNDDHPVVEERDVQAEQTNGAKYPRGREVLIAPESENVIKTEEIR